MTISTDRNRRYLESAIRLARRRVEEARESLRAAEVARDEFELRHRPSYPETDMRLALEVAARDVKSAFVPASHLGRRIGHGVTVNGIQGLIIVDPGAPWGAAANGKLWKFTPNEIRLIREHIEAQGLRVKDAWTHEGVSFRVEVAR